MLATSRTRLPGLSPLKVALLGDQLMVDFSRILSGQHCIQQFDSKVALRDVRNPTLVQKPGQRRQTEVRLRRMPGWGEKQRDFHAVLVLLCLKISEFETISSYTLRTWVNAIPRT
mgnify:CR=1 FL=1